MRKVAIAYMHDQFIYIYIITVLLGCGHWSRWHGRRRRCFGHRGWQSSMWHCLQASQVEIEGINCMIKVAIAYMHDQFIDHAKSLWVAATGVAGTGAGATGKSAGGTVCKQASQVETKCINWVVIAYMHDQFIYIYITVLVGCGHWSRWHGRRRRCFGHRGWQSSMWHCLQASQVEIEGINCMRKVAIAYMHDQFIDHAIVLVGCGHWSGWHRCRRNWQICRWHCLQAGITSRDQMHQLGGYCIYA